MIMRLINSKIAAGIAFLVATASFADTITLKNGRVINGTYLGGTARTVRVDDGVDVKPLDVSEIQRIEFSGSSGEMSRGSNRSDAPTLRRSDSSSSADSDSDRPVLRRNPERNP